MKIYVSASARRSGTGAQEAPFQTISEAARVAVAGDEVIVLPGYYREWVDPQNGGESDACRITYRSEVPGGAVISGAEPVKSWQPYEGDVWVARLSNGLFGGYNPYTTLIEGDWYEPKHPYHTGEVYLNGKSLYEADSLEGVLHPQKDLASWDPEFTVYRWYTCQEGDTTLLYANFQGADPNRENVEINVRRNCFYPSKTGVNYITLSGFVIRQAATQWAPPTAYQEGMVGPHWSKGWIIEDCELSDSKCSGISLGKFLQPENNNKWLKTKYKDGTQTERECICLAQIQGWTKEKIGHHIIRRCNIHDCQQGGIIGRMGGVFSLIEDNHIHHINNMMELGGAEIAGIKMHAAIDVTMRRNWIHHCTMGIWCDWEAQGTRISQNLLHDNQRPAFAKQLKGGMMSQDLFVEVGHGPTLIDNNILLSDATLRFATQGVAMVHNLICGAFTCVGGGIGPRYTPYHIPHRTEVMGFMTVLHGDDRFYNNIFVQKWPAAPFVTLHDSDDGKDEENREVGTHVWNGYPTYEEWIAMFDMDTDTPDMAKLDPAHNHALPVWCRGNVYFNGAKAWEHETDCLVDAEHPVSVEVTVGEDDRPRLETNLYDVLGDFRAGMVDSDVLGRAFEPEQRFENPDGTRIVFDRDYFGAHRGVAVAPGPLAGVEEATRPLW